MNPDHTWPKIKPGCASIGCRNILNMLSANHNLIQKYFDGTLDKDDYVPPAQDGGSIVNLASINGFVGYNQGIDSNLKGINPYPHSKGGVIQLTKDMAVGLAKQNIRVNALCPGYSKTNLTKMLWEDKKVEKYITSLHPMGRLADPKEIAFAALFLASDEASFITGACLPVDGGYLAQ